MRAGRRFPGKAPMLRLLGSFLHVQHRAALVGAALGAGAMRQLLLMAVRAFGDAHGGQKVVRAAKCGTACRVAPLRIRHDAVPFVSSPVSNPGRLLTALGLICLPAWASDTLNLLGMKSQDLIRPRSPASASQRGSLGPSSQVHGWLLRLDRKSTRLNSSHL